MTTSTGSALVVTPVAPELRDHCDRDRERQRGGKRSGDHIGDRVCADKETVTAI
jgi:hypothetical protein